MSFAVLKIGTLMPNLGKKPNTHPFLMYIVRQHISYLLCISNECCLDGPRASDGPLVSVSGHDIFLAGLCQKLAP
jgi:hypothetical protein